jgi:hypothetical protein
MKHFIKEILSDGNGQGSSKRVAAFWLLFLITAQAIGITFFKAAYNEAVWTDTLIAFGANQGLVLGERFSKPNKD